MKRRFACDDSGGPAVSSPIVNYFMHFDLSHHALGMARVQSLIQTIKHFIHAYKPWKVYKNVGRQTVKTTPGHSPREVSGHQRGGV